MNVKFRKSFLKDLAKIPKPNRHQIEKYVFDIMPSTNNFHDLLRIEKLQGYKTFYKIRFGDYRVGLRKLKNDLIFERVLHRKDIYKFYPK